VHPIIDPLALSAAATILSSLPDSTEGNSDSAVSQRLNLLIASWQAMFGGVGIFKSGLSHALGRQLGALCKVPHALTSCVTLPAVMEFNRVEAEEPLARLGEAFGSLNGSPKGRAQSAIDAVKRLIHSLSLPTRLRDVGVRKPDLTAVAVESLKDQAARINPRAVNNSALIMELLESIW
jgi:alcohol dehydrogenase class IV